MRINNLEGGSIYDSLSSGYTQVNELILTQAELFSFFHFMCVAADASKLFCITQLPNNKRFLYHFNL